MTPTEERSHDRIKESFNEGWDELISTIKSLEDENSTLEDEVSELKDENGILEDSIESLEEDLATANKRIEELEAQNNPAE